MIANFIKIAFRHLFRHKGYSTINIVGLAVGLASCLLIGLFIRYELSYDRFYPQAERIDRLGLVLSENGSARRIALTAPAMGPGAAAELTGVDAQARVAPGGYGIFKVDSKMFNQYLYFADSTYLSMFGLHMQQGDAATALNAPGSLVLSEKMAQTLFGTTDCLGKTVTYNNQVNLQVTGVFADIPANTHFRTNLLISMVTIESPDLYGPDVLSTWAGYNFFTYLRRSPGTSARELDSQLAGLFKRHLDPEQVSKIVPFVEPITDIHLHSDSVYGAGSGDIRTVYIFSGVALFILVLAVINFMNLTTARSARRAREIGIRKVLGSSRMHLVFQLLGEAVLLTFLALAIALALLEVGLPLLVAISQSPLTLTPLWAPLPLAAIMGGTLLVGLAAGSYPAFYLSRFQPVEVLKGQRTGGGSVRLRRALVIFQFTVSIALMIGTAVIYSQTQYLKHSDLGFQRENIVYISLNSPDNRDHYDVFQQEIRKHPGVIASCLASRILGDAYSSWYLQGENQSDPMTAIAFFTDYDFLKTFGMTLKSGRTFSADHATDAEHAFVLNETAARQFGWADPVGRAVWMPDPINKKGTVIGMVKDFKFQSLRREITPLFISFSPSPFHRNYLAVRLRPGSAPAFLKYAEGAFARFAPGQPFDYTFQDQYLDRMYRSEERLGQLVLIFAGLAIFIGSLGLLGLAAFTTEQRTREIGIRKVLGASTGTILRMLSREFVLLVAAANVLAWPVAWYVMQGWLENFAYRLPMPWTIFVAVAVLAMVLAVGIVSIQALRAALADPIDAIRHE